MCLVIDDRIKSLNKRIVWKVFERRGDKIVSLFQGASYPKGKLIKRSKGEPREDGLGTHGLHFYTTKARALREANFWPGTYIARFAVDPADFMFAGGKSAAMYERATRIGPYIKVGGNE
jgi:hypothetical protein